MTKEEQAKPTYDELAKHVEELQKQLDELAEEYKKNTEKMIELSEFFKLLTVVKIPLQTDNGVISFEALINHDTYYKIADEGRLRKNEECAPCNS